MLDASLLPLANDLVRIRRLRADDAEAFALGAADDAVRAYAHLPDAHYTTASAEAMFAGEAAAGLARGDLAVLAIAEAVSDEFAGSLVLFGVTGGEAEVGFWLHPDHRGAGRSAAALALAARFAVGSGLTTLTARTMPGNSASQSVLLRAGFADRGRAVGVAPSGKEVDLVHYVRPLYPSPSLPLETARLQLRLHHRQDAGWLHGVYSRPDVARFLLEGPWSSEDTAQNLGKRLARTGLDGECGALSLVIEHAGAPVGDVSLWLTDRERRVAEIGWVLDPDHRGQGYAAEAVAAVLGLAFGQLRLHRVVAQMDARNHASARLAQTVGMVREAHLREDWWSKGEWTDTLVYAMLAGDRTARPAPTR